VNQNKLKLKAGCNIQNQKPCTCGLKYVIIIQLESALSTLPFNVFHWAINVLHGDAICRRLLIALNTNKLNC
jgi:hypothetical protein